MNYGYLVKFVNELGEIGTAQKHLEILTKEKKVIWGQWTSGTRIISESTYQNMNKGDFYLYAMDKSVALLKLHVVQVLRKEEVVQQKLEYLIPNYYGLNGHNCSAYFLVDNIEIFAPEEGRKIVSLTEKHTSAYDANQISSNAPWRVTTIDNLQVDECSDNNFEPKVVNLPQTTLDIYSQIEELQKQINALKTQLPQSEDRVYSVYDYYSKTMRKHYIGMTNNVTRRRKEHETPSNWKNSKKYLYIMFSILSVSDFEFTILHDNLTEDEAHYWEAKEIQNHNAYYPNGFNERNESHYLS